MSREIDDRVAEAIENTVKKKANELMEEMKSETPKLHPDARCDTEPAGEWIDGETVDLAEWR